MASQTFSFNAQVLTSQLVTEIRTALSGLSFEFVIKKNKTTGFRELTLITGSALDAGQTTAVNNAITAHSPSYFDETAKAEQISAKKTKITGVKDKLDDLTDGFNDSQSTLQHVIDNQDLIKECLVKLTKYIIKNQS